MVALNFNTPLDLPYSFIRRNINSDYSNRNYSLLYLGYTCIYQNDLVVEYQKN